MGAVRVMLVAGRDGAFGAADKSAFVRRPLMLLATLPRVLGPEENVALPVSVFALEPTVKDVALSVSHRGPARGRRGGAEDARLRGGGRRPRHVPAADEAGPGRRERDRPGELAAPRGPARRSSSTCAARTARVTDVAGRNRQAGRELDAPGRLARPRRDEPGDARGLARPADRPRPPPRVPDGLPARLPRADGVGGVPAALPRQAARAHAREARAHARRT